MNQIIESSFITDPINFVESSFSFFFALIFGILIAYSYKLSSSISGGRQIATSLLPLTLTICVIITVVKSSLTLSLGLVGALSIVRFRTPIKDPEDLVYLFISIVAGLGFGANQNLFTAVSISAILLILNIRPYMYKKSSKRMNNENDINITLEWDEKVNISIQEIINVLKQFSRNINFMRYEKVNSNKSLLLKIDIGSNNIEEVIEIIKNINPQISLNIYNSIIDY